MICGAVRFVFCCWSKQWVPAVPGKGAFKSVAHSQGTQDVLWCLWTGYIQLSTQKRSDLSHK